MPEPLDFVLPGLLRGTVGGMVATGSTGKSFVALQLCVCMATKFKVDFFKLPKLDTRTYQQPAIHALYMTAEDPHEVLHHRLHTIGRHVPGELREAVYNGVEVHSLLGKNPYVAKSGKNGIERNEPVINALKKHFFVRDICFIDTLSLFHAVSENSNDEMKIVIDIFKEIAVESNTAIVFLHHTNKLSTLAGKGDEQQASRGASTLSDNIRWQWNLRTMTSEEAEKDYDEPVRHRWVLLTGPKVNYDERPDIESPVWLYRDPDNRGVLTRETPKKKEGSNGKRTSY
ncbi:MAG: helicase RepA family protein [Bacillota bacterium]